MTAVSPTRHYATLIGRAFVGAVLFGLPLMMTMEMWELGLHMDATRLGLFVAFGLTVVFGLSFYAGFRPERGLRVDLRDTLAAVSIGAVVSVMMLALFGAYAADPSWVGAVGKTAIQTVPAAMGAILARNQLTGADRNEAEDAPGSTYFGELFLMGAGALFLAFNVAPTEEVVLISYRMELYQSALLVVLSLILLHLIVYTLGFAGQEAHAGHVRAFLHFTAPGYAIALLLSLYVLWTFGRTQGWALDETASTMIVLGFPAALGAALARLIV